MKHQARALALGLLILSGCSSDPTEPFPSLHVVGNTEVRHTSATVLFAGDVLIDAGFNAEMGGRVYAFSTASPAAPALVNQADMTGIGRGTLDGQTLYFPRRTFPNGTRGDPSNGPGFVSYDVSASGALTLLHQFKLDTDPYYVIARGEYAYVIDGQTRELLVVSLANLPVTVAATPAIVRRIALPGMPVMMDIAGTYGYVASGDAGVAIIDLSVPESAKIIKTVVVGDHSPISTVHARAGQVIAHGSLRVSVLDVSTPSAAAVVGTTMLGTLDNGPIVSGSALSGNYLYCADNSGYLNIVDISDPANPHGAQTVPLPVSSVPITVAVRGDYIYVGTANDGVLVVGR